MHHRDNSGERSRSRGRSRSRDPGRWQGGGADGGGEGGREYRRSGSRSGADERSDRGPDGGSRGGAAPARDDRCSIARDSYCQSPSNRALHCRVRSAAAWRAQEAGPASPAAGRPAALFTTGTLHCKPGGGGWVGGGGRALACWPRKFGISVRCQTLCVPPNPCCSAAVGAWRGGAWYTRMPMGLAGTDFSNGWCQQITSSQPDSR